MTSSGLRCKWNLLGGAAWKAHKKTHYSYLPFLLFLAGIWTLMAGTWQPSGYHEGNLRGKPHTKNYRETETIRITIPVLDVIGYTNIFSLHNKNLFLILTTNKLINLCEAHTTCQEVWQTLWEMQSFRSLINWQDIYNPVCGFITLIYISRQSLGIAVKL